MLEDKGLPIAAIVMTIVLFIINHVMSGAPVVKPETAPANQFSAERAYNVLSTLLEEEIPHPTGSEQNKIIKLRLQAELDVLGIEHIEQATWSCGLIMITLPNCAYVENIIGIIPGRSNGYAIALMAHYDSVPMSAGIGDDGAGVAAILETARALILDEQFEHPIYLLLTDGEELGLLGAEAFFRQHPLAENVSLVLNIEGSGSTGPSMILRTSGANQLLIRTIAEETSAPYGFSFINEIFKRMPNDTDFSVPQSMGVPGVDFAFAGERNHYHTPNDNLSNIDLRTIQHHGENILPLVRSLANSDFSDLGGQVIFGEVYNVWIQWESGMSVYLILISALLLALAIYKLKPSYKGIALSWLTSLLLIVSVSVFAYGAFFLIEKIVGTPISWPAHDLSYRLTLLFASLSGGLLVCSISNRYLQRTDMLIGVWSLWLFMSIGLVIYFPDAANVLLLPTLLASLLLAIAGFILEHRRPWLYLLTIVVCIPMTIGFVFFLEQTQGYRLIVATFPFIALFFVAIMPLLKGLNLKWGLLASLLFMFVSVASTKFLPLHSEYRPQFVNITYYENLDQDSSYYQLQSPNPITGELATAMNFSDQPRGLLAYSSDTMKNWAEAISSGWLAPQLAVINEQQEGIGRSVAIRLDSLREADSFRLLIPESAELIDFELSGRRYNAQVATQGANAGYYVLNIIRVYDSDLELRLFFANSDRVDAVLMDISTQLPDSAEVLTRLRRGLTSSQSRGESRGDQSYLISEVSF
tara:strand:- start:18976 stop:21240 length:2265 start_codon:yes stop_codon:yes gene_type:complete